MFLQELTEADRNRQESRSSRAEEGLGGWEDGCVRGLRLQVSACSAAVDGHLWTSVDRERGQTHDEQGGLTGINQLFGG